ncbi:MAG: hypothetical protein HY749_06715 [Gammaproteobacteria bacterium]|nr:hypothetical protein [Gammaproteobacteria bacterium]MBI5614791.1 hypothetical protein [Gammaproteobacteria bacterium]
MTWGRFVFGCGQYPGNRDGRPAAARGADSRVTLAMLITIGASWLVGSEAATRRKLGFRAYASSE